MSIAEGDYVVQHGVRGGRWPGGAFLGFGALPGEYAREVVSIYRLEDGKLAERWAIRNDLTMLRQLRAPNNSSVKRTASVASRVIRRWGARRSPPSYREEEALPASAANRGRHSRLSNA